MTKTAIKISLLVGVFVLGTLVFLWYRNSQPPVLFGLLPADIEEAAYMDTRNLVKKTFKNEPTDFSQIEYPDIFRNIFSKAEYSTDLGLNVYSELVWFEHKEGFKCFFARLNSEEKWLKYINKLVEDSLCSDIKDKEEISSIFLSEYNAALAWRGRHLALIYNSEGSEKISTDEIMESLKPENYSKILVNAYTKRAPDIFYISFKNKKSLSAKLLLGKIRFIEEDYSNNYEIASFHSLGEKEDFSENFSKAFYSESFINILSEDSLIQEIKSSGEFKNEHLQIKTFANASEVSIPEYYDVKNSDELLFYADFDSKSTEYLPYIKDNKFLTEFKNCIVVGEKKDFGSRISGTFYFEYNDKLPYKEAAAFLINCNLTD